MSAEYADRAERLARLVADAMAGESPEAVARRSNRAISNEAIRKILRAEVGPKGWQPRTLHALNTVLGIPLVDLQAATGQDLLREEVHRFVEDLDPHAVANLFEQLAAAADTEQRRRGGR